MDHINHKNRRRIIFILGCLLLVACAYALFLWWVSNPILSLDSGEIQSVQVAFLTPHDDTQQVASCNPIQRFYDILYPGEYVWVPGKYKGLAVARIMLKNGKSVIVTFHETCKPSEKAVRYSIGNRYFIGGSRKNVMAALKQQDNKGRDWGREWDDIGREKDGDKKKELQ